MRRYQCGARFLVNIQNSEFADDECILCQIGYKKYTLIGVRSGNRWSDNYLEHRNRKLVGFTLTQIRKKWPSLKIVPLYNI